MDGVEGHGDKIDQGTVVDHLLSLAVDDSAIVAGEESSYTALFTLIIQLKLLLGVGLGLA